MAGQIVLISMVVDTEAEAAARAILAAVADAAGLEKAGIRWAPYPKLGPHSRVSAALRLPKALDGQGVIDACERLAGQVVEAAALPGAHVNGFIQDDGALFYNRTFDARASAFRRPDILWLDIEAHTHPDRQAELATLFKR